MKKLQISVAPLLLTILLSSCSSESESASKENQSVCTKLIDLINWAEKEAAPLEQMNQALGGSGRPIVSNLSIPDLSTPLSKIGVKTEGYLVKDHLRTFLQVAGQCLSQDAYTVLQNTAE